MWGRDMNLFALYLVILSVNLFIFLSFVSRAITRPEILAEEIEKFSKISERSLYRGSRKKKEILATKISLLRKRIFTISMISAVIPVIGMSIIILTLSLLYGEISLATLSSCALPPPIEFYLGGRCFIYTPWIILLSYLAIIPIYNYYSGLDLLKKR